MTIQNFKSMIAGYFSREPKDFVKNSQDLLLQAMNDARRDAQLAHMFELCRTEDAYLTTHVGGADWMSECRALPTDTIAKTISMLRIDEVWNFGSIEVDSVMRYPRSTRVDFSYSGAFKRELPTVDDVWVTHDVQENHMTINQFAYCVGTRLFVNRISQPHTYKLVGIRLLEDLSGSEDADIFLTHFTNWFKFATILALNVYLKDSERFPLDSSIATRAFELVKTADGAIANMGESTDLS
jgi:hypothetical protein